MTFDTNRKTKILFAVFILIALLIGVGMFVAVSGVLSDEQNTENEIATSTDQAAASPAQVSNGAPDGTYYYATREETTNDKGNSGPPRHTIRQVTPSGSSTSLYTFTQTEDNRILDWIWLPEVGSVLLHQQHSVELIDLTSKERTLVHQEGEETPDPNPDSGRPCVSQVSGVTSNDDASTIMVGRRDGFNCHTGVKILTFTRDAPDDEYTQVSVTRPTESEDVHSFATWRNGTFVDDTQERMLTVSARCSKGPCPPSYQVYDRTTGDWRSERPFNPYRRFNETDMLLPDVGQQPYAVKVGRAGELSYCSPPMEALPLPGETLHIENVATGATSTYQGTTTDGYNLLGFATDSEHALVERYAHQRENGCVQDTRNTVGYSVLDLESSELTPIESVAQWTEQQNTHVGYWRFGEMMRELYVDGEQIGTERDAAEFLGFARGNPLLPPNSTKNDNETASSNKQTYENDTYGFSFEYPSDWRAGDNNSADFFQLYNYDVSEAEGGHDWPDGHNKIEGGVVDDNSYSASSDFPAERVSTSSQLVADFKTKRAQVLLQGGNQIRTYFIPLRNEADEYLSLSIYGDPENFDVLEKVTESFQFNEQ